jgi:MFS family permease
MEVDKLINKYVILQFLRQMPTAMVASTYAVFLMGKGMSLSDLGLVGLSFSIFLLVAELPTGYFADRFGRKNSMIVSCLISTIAPFVYIRASNLWGCILAELIFAIGCGFYNGALDAWIKHELQCIGKDKAHLQIAGAKGLQAIQVSIAIGALSGGYLASRNMILPWIIGGLMNVAILIAVIVLMRENYQPVKHRSRLREGMGSVAESAQLKFVCALGFVLCFATATTNLYWQPFFAPTAPDPKILGVLSFSFFAVNFGGAKIAEKFFARNEARRQEKEMAFSQILLGAAMIAAAAMPVFAVSLLFYLAHEGARGAFMVTRLAYLQSAIAKESQRATIGSISSFFEQAGSIAAFLISGMMLRHGSIATVWMVSGAAAIIASAALYQWRKSARRQE